MPPTSARLFCLALLPPLLLAACAAPRGSGPAEAAPAAAGALPRAWQDAFNRADTAAVAALYAEDAVLLPPGGTMLTGGRTAVRQTVGRWMNDHTLRLGTIHQRVAGGVGHVQGSWQGRPRGGGAGIASGRYLMLFQRDADGGWRIAYHVWTRDAEPAVERDSP